MAINNDTPERKNEEPEARELVELTEKQKIDWLKNFGMKHWYCGIEREDNLCTVIRILQDYEEDYNKLKMFLREIFPTLMHKMKGHTLSAITINAFDNLREIVDCSNLSKLVELASTDLRQIHPSAALTQDEITLIQKYKDFLKDMSEVPEKG